MATFTPPSTEQWSKLHSLPCRSETPSVLQRLTDFSLDKDRLNTLTGDSTRLALYVHIPFCRELCNFCNCSIVVTRQYGLAAQYVDMLRKEIGWYGQALARTQLTSRPLEKLYIGGGTPTFLLADDLHRLANSIDDNFGLSKSADRDYCIEIDPRFFDQEMANLIYSIGFNRVHFGLEDFNGSVQQVINRKYTVERVQQAVVMAKTAGLKQVSIDLLYGLPAQTLASFTATLKQVARTQPSRVYLHQYRHQPSLFPSQKSLDSTLLPSEGELLKLQTAAVNFWQSQGYNSLGTDGFVREGDPMFTSVNQEQLYRCHRSYSRHNYENQLGIGMSATSQTPLALWQNRNTLRDYIKQVMRHNHAVHRGLTLNKDDIIRRDLIEKLACNQSVNKQKFNADSGHNFDHYFADELEAMSHMDMENLICNTPEAFSLSTTGRWYAREIAAVFDSNPLE